jgi:bifunctional ADP-heptose synthase (sugar kinase/adenylyltransferase)
MTVVEFDTLAGKYRGLRVAVVGDFCLDRYLEIDPEKKELSIETGLPVHNVVGVRAQPGGAGTVLNNLIALGIGKIFPVGFCGDDGEGFELRRALMAGPGVDGRFFIQTAQRRTFTYCKPIVVERGKTPVELNRLDSKNWTPTPAALEQKLAGAVAAVAGEVDAIVVLNQVDVAETGVVGAAVLSAIARVAEAQPALPILADSRGGLRNFPAVMLKMNRAELAAFVGQTTLPEVPGTPQTSTSQLQPPPRRKGGKNLKIQTSIAQIQTHAAALARRNGRNVFITLAEDGMVAASPEGKRIHQPALPVRGPIDVVGAGDAVTANLSAALAAGASLEQSVELANAAASIVLHQVGTTGTASLAQIGDLVLAPETGSRVTSTGDW